MATTISVKVNNGTVVGAFVYEAYTPAKCGKVIEDLGPVGGSGYFHKLRIKYITGEEAIKPSNGINDFEALIEEHKQKYERHKATLEKLKQL